MKKILSISILSTFFLLVLSGCLLDFSDDESDSYDDLSNDVIFNPDECGGDDWDNSDAECVHYMAMQLSDNAVDVNDCLGIPEQNYIHYSCIGKFIETKEDVELCELAGFPLYCYSLQAWNFADYQICEMIEGDLLIKQTCYKDVYEKLTGVEYDCEVNNEFSFKEALISKIDCYKSAIKALDGGAKILRK